MKRLIIILFSTGLLLSGCNNKVELKKEEALQLILTQLKYPKVIDYDIYCSDPVHAKKLLHAGFVTNGIVTVQKTQKFKDIGSPLIGFTDKARPYLLPTPEKDKTLDIKKVKIADEVITDVKIIETVDQTTKVEYTTGYENITPFAALLKTDLQKSRKHTVHFVSSDKGWVLQQPAR
ncbi:hypothetical protein J7E50_19600 [Pedobacter sp. ISL-68]|uniref:hypothetical protein n=1 Tax=unclassified Pedobacter TaxID=2628915 RepID=UPI001BE4E570|nr:MULTISPECIES: hypothetical protein [unclassified Pedobacter]MBT2564678.1 hypothetical protein [Pedobacter sp. ISL-64]MBT2592433.1 hypothetical protein [Pedobacter sp. ISL-68]